VAKKTTSTQINVQVTGFGWVTAAGSGRGWTKGSPLWQKGDPQPPTTVLKNLHGGSRFGRLDLYSQMGVATIALAIKDAGLLNKTASSKINKGLNMGLICATTSSCRRTDRDFFKTVQNDPRLASPGLFVYTLASSFLGEAALRFTITGITLALIEPQPSGSEALKIGLEQLAYGDEDVVVAGICNLFEKENVTAPFFHGALFLVLEKDLDGQRPFHATVSYTPKESKFYCNKQPFADILSLTKILCKIKNTAPNPI